MSISDSATLQWVKPTLETRFHIDYDWWARDERDLRLYLISHLPPDKQAQFANQEETSMVDWVDPDTAEVTQIDSLQFALQEAAQLSDFITPNTSLVDAVFRVFLANNNTPMTPIELGEAIQRAPQMILKTLSGMQVYKGIRPVIE